MTPISISPEISAHCPGIALGCIACDVRVTSSSAELLALIQADCRAMAGHMGLEDIHHLPAIAATRAAYRLLGKEPSRYRPSAEALIRRVVQGKGLYQVNNVVDVLNWVSISTGFSIGGWDAGCIVGEAVLGIGRPQEPYLTIGRGEMNIESFPVFRDHLGAFGTPTSDSERTMVRPGTRHFLMVVYSFAGAIHLDAAMHMAVARLEQHAGAEQVATWVKQDSDGK